MSNKKIFDLITLHKWNEVTKVIEENKNIDLNLRDNSSYYLINYAIMFNKYDLVKLLIEKECKLDILDADNRNILYLPIKFNYNSIFELLLNKINNIGIPIDEISDNNGLYPIHYAVLFNNIEAIKLLKKYNRNLNIEDNDGNLPIFKAISTNNLPIFELLFNEISNINYQNKNGETVLHLSSNYGYDNITEIIINSKDINVNVQDYINEVTPFMYLIILDNKNIFNKIFNKINFNLQDSNGNNILHYSIIENNIYFVNKIIEKSNIDLNVTNIYGKTFLHLLIENFKDSFRNLNLELIFQKTNLNILDNSGNSITLLILKNGLFNELSNFLKFKNVNYLVKNKNNESPFDYIQQNEYDLFYNIIIDSYLNFIRKSDNIFNNKIYNLCKNNISSKEFSEIKNDIDFKVNIKNKNDICKDILMTLLKNNKLQYPTIIKNYCIDLNEFNEDVNFVTFTGSTIDILFGILYLIKNYSSITTSVSKDFYINKNLENYYINNKNRNVRKEDFINFEIIWDGILLIKPTNLDDIINDFLKNKNQFLIIPLGIELQNGSHSNILIFDKVKKTYERFEPNGSTYPFKFNYYPDKLDNEIQKYILTFTKQFTYYSPAQYLPKIGFQILESIDKNKKIGDPGGFCAVWCIWYASMKIKYKNIDIEKLAIKLILKIKEDDIEFKVLIRKFAKNIVDFRDSILNKNNVSINDWLNSTYEKSTFNNIIKDIKDLIN